MVSASQTALVTELSLLQRGQVSVVVVHLTIPPLEATASLVLCVFNCRLKSSQRFSVTQH